MDFDWKAAVKVVAPTLGAVLGGPLAGGAIKILADAVLGGSSGDSASDEQKLKDVMAGGLTPEIRAALIQAEQQTKLAVIAADVRKAELAVDVDKAYVADVADARSHNANTIGILRLGYMINFASYSVIVLVLCGCYWIVSGKTIGAVDPGLAAVVGGLVGSAVQWLMSNCQSANNFFFGSSPAGRAVNAALASSVSKAAEKSTTEK